MVLCSHEDLSLHEHFQLFCLASSFKVKRQIACAIERCSGSHSTIDVNEVAKQHAAVITNLLGAHALSGCDTISSFAGIYTSKRRAALSLPTGDLSALLDEVHRLMSQICSHTIMARNKGHHQTECVQCL